MTRVQTLQQVRDEAFHKMTLMKAEYTGRVKRREDRITELEAKMSSLTGNVPPPSFASSCADKENDVSVLQASINQASINQGHQSNNQGTQSPHLKASALKSTALSNPPAPKAVPKNSKTVKVVEEEEQATVQDKVAGPKRSTRSTGKPLAAI